LPPAKQVELGVFAGDATVREELHRHRSYIELLARVSRVHMFSAPARPSDSVLVALEGMELYVPVLGHIDVAAERRRMEKELQKVARELAGVEAKLGNSQFVARAPEEVVEKEREREARLRERCATLERGVDRLRGVDPGP
jgi:valyl-tRNA synthetase